ncbi:MAG: nickel-dependent hydrogenase large subunit [Propionibacteriaceae bacterium]|jgi:hydrogenase large subunit|nr:nickel-dependent hydrogenase large subunit [Propionibacteriaceae bacterium]
MSTIDLNVAPLNRVEGDLDVRVIIEDGVVTDAWTQAMMFRGFETILRGKDIRAGLIMTPRICGICGGSHLYKSAYALDTAMGSHVPYNATLVRNIAQACETLQSIPRYFYALFAVDLANKKYSSSPMYDEACARFAAFTGSSYQPGVVLSQKPVEVYAIFGGQWPHSSFMCPGGIMGAPTLDSVSRSFAILNHWKRTWLEGQWLGCTVERWSQNKTWEDVLAWLDEKEEHANSDCGFFIRYALDIGLDGYGAGHGDFIATGTYFSPTLYDHPTIAGRNDALIARSGVLVDGAYHEFDQANVFEDVAHSFYNGDDHVHPFDGTQNAIDPEKGKAQGKYSFGKAPRYSIGPNGNKPLEAGPLARMMVAGQKATAPHQHEDPLVADIVAKKGVSVFTRQFARMHEAAYLIESVLGWLGQIDLAESFCDTPVDPVSARGYGATEAARGALQDWIVIENGKIANYNVITPSTWNISPRDKDGVRGPMEEAFVGAPVADIHDPVELGHVARSFDSCIVCQVHAYDGKTGREMSQFVINKMV